jgi:hypothetical protein
MIKFNNKMKLIRLKIMIKPKIIKIKVIRNNRYYKWRIL